MDIIPWRLWDSGFCSFVSSFIYVDRHAKAHASTLAHASHHTDTHGCKEGCIVYTRAHTHTQTYTLTHTHTNPLIPLPQSHFLPLALENGSDSRDLHADSHAHASGVHDCEGEAHTFRRRIASSFGLLGERPRREISWFRARASHPSCQRRRGQIALHLLDWPRDNDVLLTDYWKP